MTSGTRIRLGPLGAGTDAAYELLLDTEPVLTASTGGGSGYPVLGVRGPIDDDTSLPMYVTAWDQIDRTSDASRNELTTWLFNTWWEDDQALSVPGPSRLVASGTNYVLVPGSAGLTACEYQLDHLLVSAARAYWSDRAHVRLDPSNDLQLLSGNAGWSTLEPAEASTESAQLEGDLVAPEFDALLERIRSEYDALPGAAWFKQVYAGKSLGDVIHEL